MSVRGTGQMPPLATDQPHEEGLALIADFIRFLGVRDGGSVLLDGGSEDGAAQASIADATPRD